MISFILLLGQYPVSVLKSFAPYRPDYPLQFTRYLEEGQPPTLRGVNVSKLISMAGKQKLWENNDCVMLKGVALTLNKASDKAQKLQSAWGRFTLWCGTVWAKWFGKFQEIQKPSTTVDAQKLNDSLNASVVNTEHHENGVIETKKSEVAEVPTIEPPSLHHKQCTEDWATKRSFPIFIADDIHSLTENDLLQSKPEFSSKRIFIHSEKEGEKSKTPIQDFDFIEGKIFVNSGINLPADKTKVLSVTIEPAMFVVKNQRPPEVYTVIINLNNEDESNDNFYLVKYNLGSKLAAKDFVSSGLEKFLKNSKT